MANYTQAQCDNSTITREKLTDGSWWIRGTNEDGTYFEFADTVSASNASAATSKTNAHTFLKDNCEYIGAPVSQATEQETL